jgi:hypothetical protein
LDVLPPYDRTGADCAIRRMSMKRMMKLAVLMLPLLGGMLGGCVIYDDGYYHHRHYWRY